MSLHYRMHIQWSDEDQCYLVFLPEFDDRPKTHGETYEKAAKMGREVLELLVECYQEDGMNLPSPTTYQGE